MKNIRNRKIDNYQIFSMAFISLLLGVAYYWLTRPHDSAAFLFLLPALSLDQNQIFFTRWFGWFPTFTHVMAFSLLTFLVLGRRYLVFSCLLWGAINTIFELGQALPTEITLLLPDSINLQSYLCNGTFDLFDLIACFVGPWFVWRLLRRKPLNDEHEQATVD